jgi:hypothetical protein
MYSCVKSFSKNLADESGQVLSELIIVVPALLLAIAVIVNLGLFVAELARFDRATAEVARILVSSAEDPALLAGQVLQETMQYKGGKKGPFSLQAEVESSGELFLQKRTLHLTLKYELFAGGIFERAGTATQGFTRTKTLVIYWSTGL